jgi:hypothetical protein
MEDEEMMEKTNRLQEIIEEIKELVGEAEEMVAGTSEEASAGAYWIPHILGALDKDHGYLGGSMQTMQDSINELLGMKDE